MIINFKDKETSKVFNNEVSKKLPSNIQKRAFEKLYMLHRAKEISDLKNPPANFLEKLSGDRLGQYSIRINQQWRICFNWENNNALNVEIVDYH